jgi:FSR family fosmidomycin resistance protein-like MFS transporter
LEPFPVPSTTAQALTSNPARTGWLLLGGLTLVHALVDAFASSIQPLWPDLQSSLRLDEGSIQWVVVGWSLSTSVCQLVFGYLGDRYSGRWLLWAGPAIGILGMGLVGLSGSIWSLAALVMLGGLGVAAFHPEAATLAGSLVPEDRSRAMSIFATGGFLGQAAGPLGSGFLSERFGLNALAWNLLWGLALLACLRPDLLASRMPATPAHQRATVSLGHLFRRRRLELSVLLFAGLLRVLPAAGTPLALAFWLKARGAGNDEIGLTQSAFFLGIGLGGLACAMVVKKSQERRMLWLLPLVAVPVLWMIPFASRPALLACSFGVGMLVGLGLPVYTSYGQQLLPEGQRLASSLTMGVSWGLGGVAVAGILALTTRLGLPEWPFFIFSLSALLAGLACLRLPKPQPHHNAPDLLLSPPSKAPASVS